jgi:hypothetical protein
LRNPQDTSPKSPEYAKDKISALLNSFLEDAPEDQVVSIYRCADLGNQPVVTYSYCPDAASLKAVSLEPNSKSRRTLVVSEDFAPSGSVSISSLTDQLYQELHSDICAARFSFLEGKYKSFSNDDLNFIELSTRL